MGPDDKYGRTTPPTKEEWATIWANLEKAEKAWLIIGPIHAVVTNWRALLIVAIVVLWLNNPKILDALRVITGQGQ